MPILRSFSETEARDFYVRYLGFEVRFEHRFAPDLPLYMGLRRDAAEIHVSEHHGDASPGSAVRFRVADIDAFHAEIAGRGHPRLRPGIEKRPWGDREVALRDPFGNRIIFWASA